MNSLRRDLIERRLWPLAVILIAAIVAVPFLLAGGGHKPHAALADAAPAPAPAAGAAGASPASKSKSPATHSGAGASNTRDPFAGASTLAAGSTKTSTTGSTGSGSGSPGSGSGSGSASSGAAGAAQTTTAAQTVTSAAASPTIGGAATPSSGGSTGSSTTSSVPAQATTTTATTPATVAQTRHGSRKRGTWKVDGVNVHTIAPDGTKRTLTDLARLTPLPAANWPKLMYMGVTADGRDAVFALGSDVSAAGKARCRPSHARCTLIAVPAGTTERVSWVVGADHARTLSLTVTRITTQVIHDRSLAMAAIARHSQVGLCDLQLGDPVEFQYRSTGALQAVSNPEPACTRVLRRAATAFPGTSFNSDAVALPGMASEDER